MDAATKKKEASAKMLSAASIIGMEIHFILFYVFKRKKMEFNNLIPFLWNSQRNFRMIFDAAGKYYKKTK